ncbi:FtsK/SpoIIIE domain-containing protein [Priestia koreensis]|uniref:FtsK domain-containing protein n=1 Tax=Priestia koreensis TaxID=284581 RepID=A0A0M0L5P0_9BACI|nr:FtsK/SpoIIIE domain-containing protein [Priestia koreensis]KOO46391.1 hypothetical protein AMD01_11165 [Priestia koreensis]
MLAEIATSLTLASVYGLAQMKKDGGVGDDVKKIRQIADAIGLKKNGQSIIIRRRDPADKEKNKFYSEYIFQIPLGLAFSDFETKLNVFQDGLNIKKTLYSFSLSDIKKINIKKLMKLKSLKAKINYIKKFIKDKNSIRKSIEMSYDGMIHFKVYDQDIPNQVDFNVEKWDECNGWKLPLGENREGTVFLDLASGHFVIAGATTFGKSQLLKLMISTLLTNKPNETEMTLVDLKGGLEMQYFEDCKQTINFADDIETAVASLKHIVADIQQRQKMLRVKKVNNVKKAGINKRHFIIVDEASQLAPSQVPSKYKELAKEAQAYMSYITRIGHSMGYTLVYATQYPVGDVMPNQIKANSNTTICFRLETDTQSETVLDQKGAEQIQLQGRCILSVPSGRQQVQTYLIDDKTIKTVVTPNIVIKSRKDDTLAEVRKEGTTNRRYTLELEETEVLN